MSTLPEQLSGALSRALAGAAPTDADLRAVIEPAGETGEHVQHVAALSRAVKQARTEKKFGFCAIVNAKSGKCTEDCAFCAQSSHNRADAPVHDFLPAAEIGRAARLARSAGATRFGIVASGLEPTENDFALLEHGVAAVRAEGLAADVSVGVLDNARIETLKRSGLSGVHHNLETGRTFFPNICSTHDYEQDVEAVRVAVASGLHVCSGGIFGVGEGWEDRIELAQTLRDLQVPSIPLNFLHPVAGTRCAHLPVPTALEAVCTVALFRLLCPEATLRICGGRQDVFPGELSDMPFTCGADGVMIGNYLTIKGGAISGDAEAAERIGLELE